MVLYMIGLGLGDEDDITVKGLKVKFVQFAASSWELLLLHVDCLILYVSVSCNRWLKNASMLL